MFNDCYRNNEHAISDLLMICYHFKLDNESEIIFLAKTVNSKQSKDRQTNRFLVAAAFQVLINFSCLTVDICSRELPGSGGR